MAFNRKDSSDSLLETADDLVDQLDNLADILAEIEDTFQKEEDLEGEPKRPNIFRRLKDGLDSARSLIACLKREKWRVNCRKMSVDLRMGELEDYKSHLKADMNYLNVTVDDLAARLMQSENDNCTASEIIEDLELGKAQVEQELQEANKQIQKLNEEKEDLNVEIKSLKRVRTDSYIRRENDELKSEIDVLQEERQQLKAIIRAMEQEATINNSQDGGSEITDVNLNALNLKSDDTMIVQNCFKKQPIDSKTRRNGYISN